MKAPHIFVNPNLLKKIKNKVDVLMNEWGINPNERHTIYQMVATIESGIETRVFYYKNGIVCDGWNGYRHYLADMTDPDPRSAFQGFYRTDKNQYVGWSIYLIDQADDKEAQASHCNLAYGLYLVWEDCPRVWGFYSFQDYYTPEEQAEALRAFEGQPHVKRVICHPKSEMSWMYRLQVETTRKRSGLKNEWRKRIAV